MTEVVFGAQAYRKNGRKYEAGTTVTCNDETIAMAEAEKLASRRGSCGAVAYSRRKDEYEFGGTGDPITLGAFGDVPPEVRDLLPF